MEMLGLREDRGLTVDMVIAAILESFRFSELRVSRRRATSTSNNPHLDGEHHREK